MLTLLPAFYCGATYILHKQFDAQAMIDTIAAEKVTHIMMVPSQIIAMLNLPTFNPNKVRSLEMILSLGAPLHKAHKEHHLHGGLGGIRALSRLAVLLFGHRGWRGAPATNAFFLRGVLQ
jgi:hypothetical protein